MPCLSPTADGCTSESRFSQPTAPRTKLTHQEKRKRLDELDAEMHALLGLEHEPFAWGQQREPDPVEEAAMQAGAAAYEAARAAAAAEPPVAHVPVLVGAPADPAAPLVRASAM